MTVHRRRALIAGAVLAASLLAGCGTTAAPRPGRAVPAAKPSLATSQQYAGETWAIVVMGGSSAAHNNFWQIFTRAATSARWTLATPLGVADNGGLAVADVGGQSLVAAVRPSQALTFTPLAASRDGGAHWSQSGLLTSGLADFPSALAGAPSGGLIALNQQGNAEQAVHAGAAWTHLAAERTLAASAAGRACGLAGLTAAAFSSSGVPLLAGGCSRPGTAGIFAPAGGGWRASGPALPPSLAGQDIEVLGLAGVAGMNVALLQAGLGPTASLISAWSSDGGSRWRLSAPFGLRGPAVLSTAFGAGGAVGVTLTGGGAVAVTGPGAAWHALPPLPAQAAKLPAGASTLAAAPGGGFEALIAQGGKLTVWQLAAGGAGWGQAQRINVAIPYGSSG